MNSGAPASMAPPESASAGMMVWHKALRVLYSLGEKNFGAYAPAGEAAFSAATMWCAYSAACSGITRNTEPTTAPMVSDFRMSRRDMDFAAADFEDMILLVVILSEAKNPYGHLCSVLIGILRLRWPLLRAGQTPLRMTKLNSQASLLRLRKQILRSPPAKRHDGERWILVRVGHKAGAVGHEQILHIVRLAKTVEHRSFGIVPHAGSADLVNNDAAIGDAVGPRPIAHRIGAIGAAGAFDDGLERFLHVLGHFYFVVAPLPMEAQYRNAPPVNRHRIKFAVAVLVWNHLPTAGEMDAGAISCAAFLF